MVQIPMIDVSANNHLADEKIDWEAVKAAGYGAAMVKCSEGVDYENPWLADDADGAALAGLRVGYYHFAHPAASTGREQAAYALDAIVGRPRDLGLALDLEVYEGKTPDELAAFVHDYHAEARKTVDHSPLYTPSSMLEAMPGAPWGERLWLPSTARPRREVWAWQTTTPAMVKGIALPTDVGWLHPDA